MHRCTHKVPHSNLLQAWLHRSMQMQTVHLTNVCVLWGTQEPLLQEHHGVPAAVARARGSNHSFIQGFH